MYIHLGNGVSVRGRSVIGIFDIENTTTGKTTGQLLDRATKEGRVINVSYDMPKSFILCREKDRETVYISNISVATLKKRAGKLF